jgi:hypothetical protein
MRFDYATRAKTTLILLIGLVLVSDIYFAFDREIFNMTTDPRYDIDLRQTRFELLQQRLPRRGLIGYLGDKSNVFENPSVLREYYIAQYILSPLIIAPTVSFPLVVGNFYDVDSQLRLPKSTGLVLISDFGNGLQLFHGQSVRTPGIDNLRIAEFR